MLVWLLKDGENLPIQPGARRMRMGMLANALLERGHSVEWWASTFSHQRKTLLYNRDTQIEVREKLRLNLLHAGSYRHNISLARYRHHRRLARKFRRAILACRKPSVIVCAFPLIDLGFEVIGYGVEHWVPTILDIRDLWPDTYLERCPRLFRQFLRLLLERDFRRTRESLQGADSLVAISRGCLGWGLRYAGRSAREHDEVFYTGYPKGADLAVHSSIRVRDVEEKLRSKVVFCYVGSFGTSYELGLICDVAGEVEAAGRTSIHFILAGDGEQFGAISRRVRCASNVTLTGWLDESEVRKILSLSHVGIVPNRMVVDAAPNKVFEYLSAGLPVISSLEGEMERILNQNEAGYTYRCGDADGLFRCVLQMADDRIRRDQMAAKARELYDREFQESSIYPRFAQHVERIAEVIGKESC